MKHKREVCSIYLLTNQVNGKIYVGQTWGVVWERGGRVGRAYSNSPYLYAAILKYGFENFEYSALYRAETQEEGNALEDYYIEKYNSKDPNVGYNLKSGGVAGRHSEETKAKISAALTGREVSEETRRKISELHTGIKKPPHTDEWKEQNSLFMKRRHVEVGHPMLGRHQSEEAKAKIAAANIGKFVSDETIKKRINTKISNRDAPRDLRIIADYQSGLIISILCTKYTTKSSEIYRILHRNNISLREKNKRYLFGKTK